MTAVSAFAPVQVQDAAPPPMPATLEATGLSPDRVEQLLIKTLYRRRGRRGWRSPTACACRTPPSSRSSSVCAPSGLSRFAARRASAARATATALTDLGRDRARQYLDDRTATSARRRCRSTSYVDYMHTLRSVARLHRPGAHAPRLLAPGHQRTAARSARSGCERQQGGLPVRTAGQREDRDCRRHGARRGRRHVRPVRHRHRRQHHHRCTIRPTTSRSRPTIRIRSASSRLRHAIGGGFASGGRS